MNEEVVPVTTRYIKIRRVFIGVQYVLILCAGVVSMIKPTPTVYSVVPPVTVYLWAGFFVLGGLTSLLAVASGYRIGEVVGIPLIGSACLIYGVAVVYQSTIQTARSVFVFIFVGVLFVSYAAGLFERFISALNVVQISEETRRRERVISRGVRSDNGVSDK